MAHDPSPAALPNFKLADKLGQGGMGSVFKALDWNTGETVAIKQIGLSNIPKAELPEIMVEIDLMKSLDHPNIVQYRGYVKTAEFLYIILEYCENGSLHSITKKFGRFPESLVALYVLQVLHGLLYLHDQGVIHRDIKGSNILATKEGSIKLADFGVATRAGGAPDSAVVGSPYWMAPEVVDQSGATTASDIWSLGALVIELITGKPPYHYLDPMPALFRIVNDDCPPIPEAASAVARDFLLQCFQKDVNLRVSARKLLRHPWMMAAKRQVEQTKREQVQRSARPTSGYDFSVQKVQEYNKALEAPAVFPGSVATSTNGLEVPGGMADGAKAKGRLDEGRRLSRRPSAELALALNPKTNNHPDSSDEASKTKFVPRPREASAGAFPASLLPPPAVIVAPPESAHEEEDDNWDGDFEEGSISVSKIAALDRSDESGGENEDNSVTIRPPSRGLKQVQKEQMPMDAIVEDYSDLVPQGEEDPFKSKVASLQQSNSAKGRLLKPTSVQSNPANSTKASPVKPLSVRNRATPTSSPRLNTVKKSASPAAPTRKPSIEIYSEADDSEDDYSDLFQQRGSTFDSRRSSSSAASQAPALSSLKLNARLLSGKSWLGDEGSDEEDPFAEVEEEGFTDGDLEANLARDKLARTCANVTALVDAISDDDVQEYDLREASLELLGALELSADARAHFTKSQGMLAVNKMLQITRSRDILGILLRIVNLIVGSDPATLEKICLVGGCPVVMAFSSNKYSREIRLEAALFIGAMCRTSLLTLQMFISCRGIKTLVDMMDENYAERKDLVWMAVDGISRVFEMHGPTPRNDFCRIFTHEGLLEPLASALRHVCQDDDDLAESAKAKMIHILLLFSQSDRRVKEAMSVRPVVLQMVRTLSVLEPELLAPLLRTIKNLTMVPTTLEVLQNANAIDALVRILSEPFEGKLAAEIQNNVINALFNLCRLSKTRQEEAAVAGAIPVLQKVVEMASPLKQFALPILCDFAHASKTTRRLLWRHDGLAFYLGLLRDPFWANPALEALLAWLVDEPARVEDCLLEQPALEALLRAFCTTTRGSFDALLEPLLKMMRASTPVAAKLATQSAFFKRITDRLQRGGGKAVVRLNLLRIVKVIFDAVPANRARVAKVQDLRETVAKMAREDAAVLVKRMAMEMEREFEQAIEGPSQSLATPTKSGSLNGVEKSKSDVGLVPARRPSVRKAFRRARSESGTGLGLRTPPTGSPVSGGGVSLSGAGMERSVSGGSGTGSPSSATGVRMVRRVDRRLPERPAQ